MLLAISDLMLEELLERYSLHNQVFAHDLLLHLLYRLSNPHKLMPQISLVTAQHVLKPLYRAQALARLAP